MFSSSVSHSIRLDFFFVSSISLRSIQFLVVLALHFILLFILCVQSLCYCSIVRAWDREKKFFRGIKLRAVESCGKTRLMREISFESIRGLGKRYFDIGKVCGLL